MEGDRPSITSLRGVVATAHPLATLAGIRLLLSGGNAIDAAVGTAAALNVVEPYMSGIGGIGFATCYLAKEGRVHALDFTTPVPRHFKANCISRTQFNMSGAQTIATPGNLAGLLYWTLMGQRRELRSSHPLLSWRVADSHSRNSTPSSLV